MINAERVYDLWCRWEVWDDEEAADEFCRQHWELTPEQRREVNDWIEITDEEVAQMQIARAVWS